MKFKVEENVELPKKAGPSKEGPSKVDEIVAELKNLSIGGRMYIPSDFSSPSGTRSAKKRIDAGAAAALGIEKFCTRMYMDTTEEGEGEDKKKVHKGVWIYRIDPATEGEGNETGNQ